MQSHLHFASGFGKHFECFPRLAFESFGCGPCNRCLQVTRGREGDLQEGMPESAVAARGLLVTTLWVVREGMAIGLEREYDARGRLVEVRLRRA